MSAPCLVVGTLPGRRLRVGGAPGARCHPPGTPARAEPGGRGQSATDGAGRPLRTGARRRPTPPEAERPPAARARARRIGDRPFVASERLTRSPLPDGPYLARLRARPALAAA